MAPRVCPWWIGYFLVCPWRRFLQDPAEIVGPYVRQGMTVLEPGPGMGFFTLDLARGVGESGRVIAVDIQPKMLDRLKRRAAKAGLADRLDVRLARPDSMGLDDVAGKIDFIFAFAVVHEVPDTESFFQQCAACLKPQGAMLVAEPPGHVTPARFQEQLATAAHAGLVVADRPSIPRSHAASLKKAS